MSIGAFDRVLDGKVAVITGAGRGIGRAIAIAYAQAGASVVCSARSETEINATAETITRKGGRSIHCVADVTDAASTAGLFTHAVRFFGAVDIVIANAGIPGESAAAESTDPDSWRNTIEVN